MTSSDRGPRIGHRILGVVVLVATTAVASGSTSDVIAERQKGFKALGAAFKHLRDASNAGSLTPNTVQAVTGDIHSAAASIQGWFPAGSGPESGVKTAAKPEIWTDAAGFAAARDQFVQQVAQFERLAGSSGVDVAALKSLGQTCGACHDKYRVKQE